MNKAATLTRQEAQQKAQAEQYLAQSQRILRELATERKREERKHRTRASIVSEVKAILERT
jgi:hypothetical protein